MVTHKRQGSCIFWNLVIKGAVNLLTMYRTASPSKEFPSHKCFCYGKTQGYSIWEIYYSICNRLCCFQFSSQQNTSSAHQESVFRTVKLKMNFWKTYTYGAIPYEMASCLLLISAKDKLCLTAYIWKLIYLTTHSTEYERDISNWLHFTTKRYQSCGSKYCLH